MKKRLFVFVMVLSVFMMTSALAAEKLEMFLNGSPMGVDAPSFYAAYGFLCDKITGEGSTKLTQEVVYDNYGLDTYAREGMRDVQVLYLLPNHEVIAVSCQMKMNTSQDKSTVYANSKAFGQTVPTLLSVLSYLEGGEDFNALQTLMPELQKTTMDIMSGYQNFASNLDPGKAAQVSDTLIYQNWRLSYYFDWDKTNITGDVFLHAQSN